jgi:hypothetical protein
MSKYTPGPWVFESRSGDHPLNNHNGWGIDGLWAVNGGLILGSDVGWDGGYVSPEEADARLIEAAPELFELLKFMLDQYVPVAADIVFGEDWVKEAKFTIAKVLGEST